MTGRAAVDVDECRDVTGTCGVGAESCVNDIGGYVCTCRNGYEFKDGTCTGSTRSSSHSLSLSLSLSLSVVTVTPESIALF